MSNYDVLIIGGGMAGVSLGYELASDRSVGLVERESTLAQHTTGRSAATYLESYGGRIIRLLTTSSRAFLEEPPEGFEGSMLRNRPLLWLGPEGRTDDILGLMEMVKEFVPTVALLEPEEALKICPIVRPEYLEVAMLEPGASDIDVHKLHQGYTRGLRQRGGHIHTRAGVQSMERKGDVWRVETADGEVHEAPIVVNAAGAWVDEVAALAGAEPIAIHPLRRTIFMLPHHGEYDIQDLPVIGDIDLNFYLKPEGTAQFQCSPSDETLEKPGDSKPQQIDIARALEFIEQATTIDVRHVSTSWAGQRNFVPDRVPVVGYDTDAEGFFWFAGQGGYGIQTAPSMAQTAASLIRTGDVPAGLADMGLTAADLHRGRLAGMTEMQDH